MKRNKVLWIGLLMLPLLLLKACTIPELAGLGRQVTNTEIYFSDAFDQPSAEWNTYSEPGASVVIEDGGFHFAIDKTNFDYWSTARPVYGSVQLEVDAVKLDGPDNNDFGLICRYKDQDNFYAFLLSSDGYYGILRVLDGQYQLISAPEMQKSDAVLTGNAINHLRADCIGSQLVFYVNNQFLATVEDASFLEGQAGLLVGAYEQAGVNIFFDNFVARRPQLLK